MKNRGRMQRIVASVVAGLIVLALLASIFSELFFNAMAATQASVDALRKEIADITAEKKAIQKELDELSGEKKTILAKKSALEREATLLQKEIDVSTGLIAELGELIVLKTAELADAEEDEARQYELFKKRVRIMYEQGDLNYLEVLLDAGSFADMLSRYEIVSQIMTYDRKVAASLKEAKEAVEAAKLSLETDMAEEVALKASLEESKKTLDAKIKESEAYSKQLEKDEATAKREYAAMEAEEEKLQKELKAQIAALAKKSVYVGGTMMWPLPSEYQEITSPFGYRMHPTLKVNKLHSGTDIYAPKGTPIYAANDGEVVTSTYSNAWGNYVVINHGGGTATLYAHMSKRIAAVGKKVKKGETIGLVGSTGYSTGNHLHFEIIKDGQSVDAMKTEFKKVAQ